MKTKRPPCALCLRAFTEGDEDTAHVLRVGDGYMAVRVHVTCKREWMNTPEGRAVARLSE